MLDGGDDDNDPSSSRWPKRNSPPPGRARAVGEELRGDGAKGRREEEERRPLYCRPWSLSSLTCTYCSLGGSVFILFF